MCNSAIAYIFVYNYRFAYNNIYECIQQVVLLYLHDTQDKYGISGQKHTKTWKVRATVCPHDNRVHMLSSFFRDNFYLDNPASSNWFYKQENHRTLIFVDICI